MATLKLRGNVWYSDMRVNGKRVQRALSSDKRIAQKKLDEMQLLRRVERTGETPTNVSIDFFLQRHSTIEKSPLTKMKDEIAFRYLRDTMPVTRLSEITPELLHRVKYKWEHCGKCKDCAANVACKNPPKTLSTVASAISKIKAAMRVAEAWRYTVPQPWHSVKTKKPKARTHFFTIEQLERLFRACDSHCYILNAKWKTFAALCSLAGLRPSEAYYLEWSDIDFESNTIFIHAKEYLNWSPKNRKERHIPIQKDLRVYLQTLPDRTGFVFGPERPTIGSLVKLFKIIVKKAGLKGSAYTLRHTFASHLVMNRVPLATVKEYMGHSSITMTQVYTHLLPQVLQDEINMMPQIASGLHPGSTDTDILKVI